MVMDHGRTGPQGVLGGSDGGVNTVEVDAGRQDLSAAASLQGPGYRDRRRRRGARVDAGRRRLRRSGQAQRRARSPATWRAATTRAAEAREKFGMRHRLPNDASTGGRSSRCRSPLAAADAMAQIGGVVSGRGRRQVVHRRDAGRAGLQGARYGVGPRHALRLSLLQPRISAAVLRGADRALSRRCRCARSRAVNLQIRARRSRAASRRRQVDQRRLAQRCRVRRPSNRSDRWPAATRCASSSC